MIENVLLKDFQSIKSEIRGRCKEAVSGSSVIAKARFENAWEEAVLETLRWLNTRSGRNFIAKAFPECNGWIGQTENDQKRLIASRNAYQAEAEAGFCLVPAEWSDVENSEDGDRWKPLKRDEVVVPKGLVILLAGGNLLLVIILLACIIL